MTGRTRVYIATSLDGFIATTDHGLDWLEKLKPPEEGEDYGFAEFMGETDALLMGRRTYDAIGHLRPWPYERPVFVASSSMTAADIDDDLEGQVHTISGPPAEMISELHRMGHQTLYIDGGSLITSFLNADLVDQITISTIPVLLGAGIPLFGALDGETWWQHTATNSYPSGLVQSTYQHLGTE